MTQREIKIQVLQRFSESENWAIAGHEKLDENGNWVYQRIGRDNWLLGIITDNQGNAKFIRKQFTGLLDKNGKEIYEGDVIKYYYLSRYTQQSHYDVRPEIDELIICSSTDSVVFVNGCLVFSKDVEDMPFYSPISEYGLNNIASVKEQIFGEQLKHLSEEEQYADCDGNEINDSIIGIEVIGNIYENNQLLKP